MTLEEYKNEIIKIFKKDEKTDINAVTELLNQHEDQLKQMVEKNYDVQKAAEEFALILLFSSPIKIKF